MLNSLKLLTVPVVSINRNDHIESFFSGCLLRFRDNILIISVAHGLKNKHSRAAIVMHNLPQLQNIPNWCVFNPMRARQFSTKHRIFIAKIIVKMLKVFRVKDDVTSFLFKYVGAVDFMASVVRLKYPPVHSLPLNSDLLGNSKRYFSEDQIAKPHKDGIYSFYGMTHFRCEENNFLCDEVFATNIKYIKTEGYYHKFKLAIKYDHLKGCSGSPIVDANGNLVSLLVRRHRYHRDIVYGIDMEVAKMILNIEMNSITGEEVYG